MQTNQQHINYTFEDIEKYFQGKMTTAEMHELEKAALQDVFLADAIDGYRNSSLQQSQQDLKDIRNKILNKEEETKIILLPSSKKWIWVAASAVGIILTGSLFWLNNKTTESNNQVVIKSTPLSVPNKDSIKPIPQQQTIDSTTKTAANISGKTKTIQQKNSVTTNSEEDFAALKKPLPDTINQFRESIAANGNTELSLGQTVQPINVNSPPAVNLSAQLQGKVAGIAATNEANNKSIRIRGITSTGHSKNPLMLINGAASSQNLASINPNDIKSIQILKDSVATAMYGSAGSNGVILVTTKPNNSITGRIVDDKGNPVPNASVTFGNKKGTQTNDQGYFNIASNDSVLKSTVAAIGYNSANQTLYKNKANNIILQQNVANLDEVVVTGYSSAKRYSVTGAAASVMPVPEAEPSMPEGGWDNYKAYLINELEKETALKGVNIHGKYTFKYGLDENNHPKSIKIISSPNKRINPYFIKAIQNGVEWHVTAKSSQKYKETIQL